MSTLEKAIGDDAMAGGATRTLQPPYGRGVAKLKKGIPAETIPILNQQKN
ncbi:MAG: hypothetical protein ACT4O2_09880 [Beijerinckiaceae bacterium]